MLLKRFGSQCIVISIDAKKVGQEHRVFSNGGQNLTESIPEEFSKISEESGAGEILINSIDRDGLGNGYDIELIKSSHK